MSGGGESYFWISSSNFCVTCSKWISIQLKLFVCLLLQCSISEDEDDQDPDDFDDDDDSEENGGKYALHYKMRYYHAPQISTHTK